MGVGTEAKSKGGAIKLIAVAVLGVAVVGAIGAGVNYMYTHPSLYVVNVSGSDGVSVFVDGEPLASNLKNAAAENRSLVSMESVKSGSHKLEAKDASGKVIDGSPEAVVDVTDVWTFARTLGSRDPNWHLVATEAGQ